MAQLVLIPGLAANAEMWQAQLAALPAALRPVVSSVHARPDALSIEQMAALLLAEHSGPLLLCGASMGAMVAMEAVRQAPQRVAGLALLGTTARPEAADMRALREAAIELFLQGKVREVIEPNVAFAFHPDHAAQPALVQAYLDFVLGAGAAQLVRQNRAVIRRPDARTHLPNVACPTLVLCGAQDQLTPPDCSAEIAGLVPGAQLEVLERCGHMLTLEQPVAVNQSLRRWLERCCGSHFE
jgi:pimeloyl-ACP methyl ester carboxylesterase